MKYFSTFSGIGGFEKAIQDVYPDWECVGYSEIEKYPIQIYKKHFPNHKNYGDITKIDIKKLPDFDLLVGGSPCTDLSISKQNRQGLKGQQSKLFFNFIEILKVKKPKYFLLENVASMTKDNKNKISEIIGVEPVMINSSLVSGQNRKRLFWCNWKVEQPKDREIYLKDILEEEVDEKYLIHKTPSRYKMIKEGKNLLLCDKSLCISVKVDRWINFQFIPYKNWYRNITTKETERLQTFPDNWTAIGINEKGEEVKISNTQRYKGCGNAVTVEVIKEIIKQIK